MQWSKFDDLISQVDISILLISDQKTLHLCSDVCQNRSNGDIIRYVLPKLNTLRENWQIYASLQSFEL